MPDTSGGERSADPLSIEIASQVVRTLRWNSRLNFAARLLLMLFSLVAAGLAVLYVTQRADAIVQILREPGTTGDMIGERLLALTAPVLLLALFAGLAAAAVVVVHSRGAEENHRTLDSINRLRREGEVAVSARGLIVAFEEQLGTARRAFTLLLWFGRTLFIVCLGLFAAALLNAVVSGVDWWTVGLGASSLGGAVFGVAQKVPDTVANHLANVIQVQAIVTGTQRQISLLESDAFAALNHDEASPEQQHGIVMAVQERMERVVKDAVGQIQHLAEPAAETREAGDAPVTPLRSVGRDLPDAA
jgi:hypothetical protein